jgi:hypothetical protein
MDPSMDDDSMIPYSISNGPAKKLNSKVVSSSIKGT